MDKSELKAMMVACRNIHRNTLQTMKRINEGRLTGFDCADELEKELAHGDTG
jgi:hypothetical protein